MGNERPVVVHQSGEKHLPMLKAYYASAGVKADCVAFIEDMAGAYDWADLVICRAGALTVAELAAAGVASLLVPFPHAVDDHQTSNARFLSSAGAAILLPQDQLTPERWPRSGTCRASSWRRWPKRRANWRGRTRRPSSRRPARSWREMKEAAHET
jgi:UDP-N-acetylglucosamine:LPS N-acetylglucosamine transferase